MTVRGLSLIGYVGKHRQCADLLEVSHASHINRADGLRKTFRASTALPVDATAEDIAKAFGETARLSLLEAIKNEPT